MDFPIEDRPIGTCIAPIAGKVSCLDIQDAVGKGIQEPARQNGHPIDRDANRRIQKLQIFNSVRYSQIIEVGTPNFLGEATKIFFFGAVKIFAFAGVNKGDGMSLIQQKLACLLEARSSSRLAQRAY